MSWECSFMLFLTLYVVYEFKNIIYIGNLNNSLAFAKRFCLSVLLRVLKGTALGLVSLSSCRLLRRSSSSPQEKSRSQETPSYMWPELSTSSVSFKNPHAAPHVPSEDIQKVGKVVKNSV